MRKLNSQFATSFISETGLDGQNGTYYGFVEMDRYYCLAVAEGYDGDGGKESAKLAVDAAIEAFVQKPGMSARRIRKCLKKAHKSLKEQSVRVRLKAGILLLVSDYTRFRYGVCGNVMLYGFRNAGIYCQSLTHTVYQRRASEDPASEDGFGPKEETRNLYHYLGGDGGVTVSGKIKLEDGDVLLAATEGFWSRVNKVEILDAYESIRTTEEFLEDLQELYLRGSADSIPCCSLAALDVKKVYQENRVLKKKLWIWGLILLLVFVIVGLILFFCIRAGRRKQQEIRGTAAVYEDTGDRYLTEMNALLARQEYEKAAEEGRKLSKNAERLEMEQLFSDKINLSVLLDQADQAFEAEDYTQAREGYKKALELVKKYEELALMKTSLGQRLKLTGTGMEIDQYIQSAALKEAEGDTEGAAGLYEQAEAMLRLMDRPERLREVQLALLRVKGQAEQEAKDARAKSRDEVIADADKAAALDAVLAGDFEAAIEQYTKIRDSYIAMEENEKAEEAARILLELQKQARTAKETAQESIEEDKAAALDAVLAGDVETALQLYEKVREAYFQMEDEDGAGETEDIIASLKEQAAAEGSGEDAPGPSGPGAASEEVPDASETAPAPETVSAPVAEETEAPKKTKLVPEPGRPEEPAGPGNRVL